MVRAVIALRTEVGGLEGRLVVDVGAGDGWSWDLLPEARLLAIDRVTPTTRRLRQPMWTLADMLHLPLGDRTADVVLFCASLHHAPLVEALGEAARVLRPGGVIAILESPIYSSEAALGRARLATVAYHRRTGALPPPDRYLPFTMGDLLEMAPSLKLEPIRVGLARHRYGRLAALAGREFPLVLLRSRSEVDLG